VGQTGIDSQTWFDQADIRPTMLLLLGLKDDYSRRPVIAEELEGWALPKSMKQFGTFIPIAQVYKQINAPLAQLGLTSLGIFTTAVASTASGDSTYSCLEDQLSDHFWRRCRVARRRIREKPTCFESKTGGTRP
jgi:hypothetical protein